MTRVPAIALVTIWMGIASGAAAPALAAQVRDRSAPVVRAPVTASGRVSGRIVDQANQPVPRALVLLSAVGAAATDPASRVGPFTALTGADGTFLLDGIAPGQYQLSASRPAYVTAHFGARRPSQPGATLTVAAAAALDNLVLTLAKGAVIAGHVTDQNGQPAANVDVQVLRYAYGPGGRALVPATPFAGTPSTDDRGDYRVYGLVPGEYAIGVMPRLPLDSAALLTTGEDVERALADARSRGGRPAPEPRASDPAAPAAGGVPVQFARVYYPDVAVPSEAVAIKVAAGEERTGVDIPISFARTARVDGTVTASDGALGGVHVNLLPAAAVSAEVGSTTVQPDGRFAFTAVPPGEYVVAALDGANVVVVAGGGVTRTTSFTSQAPPLPRPSGRWALANISVSGGDVSGIALTLEAGLTITGRVRTEDASVPIDMSRLRVALAARNDVVQAVRLSDAVASVEPDGRFSFTGVSPGKYRIALSNVTTPASASAVPAAWHVDAVLVGGRDVSDAGLDVSPGGIPEITLELTDRVSELGGLFQDASGRTTADDMVVLFSTDRTTWTWQSRRILTTRPASNGAYAFRGVPPGEYFLTAVTDLDTNEWFDPEILTQLVPASIRVTIGKGEKVTQNIRTR